MSRENMSAISPKYNMSVDIEKQKELDELIKGNEELKAIAEKYSGDEYLLSPKDVLREVRSQMEIDKLSEDGKYLKLIEDAREEERRKDVDMKNAPSIILKAIKDKFVD